MKVRIGFTTPLILEDEANSLLSLPYFQDRNFAVSTPHSIWIESKKELEIANQTFAQERRENIFAIRGSVKNEDLIKIGSPLRIAKSAGIKTSWAKDTNNSKVLIRQEIIKSAAPKTERLIFVIDTSAQMKDFQAEIAENIKNLSTESQLTLVFPGGNGLNTENSTPNSFTGNETETAQIINRATFNGGTDSVSAIEKAWEMAQEKPNSAIIWIHAPQSVELSSPLNLTQLWTRRPNSAPIYSLQVKNGKDSIERVLNESNVVNTVPRFGSVNEDLIRLFNQLTQQKETFSAVRSVENNKSFGLENSKETSQHLVKLWAKDEVDRLLINKEVEKATELAVKNQLVTQVSGAVVLENKQQYDQFGLTPVDVNTVPTIPEPEEYLLFGVVLAILLWFVWRYRQKRFQFES